MISWFYAENMEKTLSVKKVRKKKKNIIMYSKIFEDG